MSELKVKDRVRVSPEADPRTTQQCVEVKRLKGKSMKVTDFNKHGDLVEVDHKQWLPKEWLIKEKSHHM